MTDEVDRKPKFAFKPTVRMYGKLDLQHELIVCSVYEGRLREIHYPKSWEEGVLKVGSPEKRGRILKERDERKPLLEEWQRLFPERDAEYQVKYAAWKQDRTLPKPPAVPAMPYATPIPEKLLLVGLNESRDCYESVFDPFDLGGEIDPMMLLKFRRKI